MTREAIIRFMVQLTFIPDPAIPSLLPAEQARVGELVAQGTIQALYLAADSSRGWLVMAGDTQAQVDEAIASLPLHPYMRAELVEISPYDPVDHSHQPAG